MRKVKEWIAENDNQHIPDRVVLRVFRKHEGRCAGPCGQKLTPGRWALDHETALCNGGEHRENNLRPMCDICHGEKTKIDVAKKAVGDRKAKAMLFHKRRRHRWGYGKDDPLKKKIGGELVPR